MAIASGFASSIAKEREEERIPSIKLLSEREEEDKIISPEDIYGVPEAPKTPDELYGKPKVSTTDYVLNETKRGLIDLLSVPGLAVDATAEILNIATELFRDEVPEITNPALGSQHLKELLEGVSFTKDFEPPSDKARYAGSIARFSAPTIFTGPFIAALQGLSKAEKARVIVTEASSGLLGGAGAEVGADVAEELGLDPETGRTIGGITGTLAPLPAQTAISEGMSRIKGLKSEEFQTQMGKAKASTQLATELEAFPDAKTNLIRYKELSDNIPGWSVSTGRATGAPGIISLEKNLAEKSAVNLELAIESDKKAKSAIALKLAKEFPDEGPDITKIVGSTHTKVVNKLKGDLVENVKQQEKLSDKFILQPTDKIGARLKELKKEAEEIARVQKNLNYEEVYAKADELRIEDDVSDIFDFVQKTIKSDESRFQGPNMPGVFNQITRKFAPEQTSIVDLKGQTIEVPKQVSFRELHSLMKRANFEYQAAKRGNDPTLTNYLGELKTKLKEHVDDYLNSSFGEVADKLKEANKFYVGEYQDVFKRGAGAKLTNFNKYGDTTPDEEVVRKVFLDRATGVQDFFKIYGDGDEAYKLLKDGILDIFSKSAVKNGTISEAGVRTFRKTYKTKLNDLPEIRDMLNDSVKLNEELVNRQAILNNKITAINGSNLKKLAGVQDHEALLDNLIKNPKSMKAMAHLASKQPNGIQSLAHSLAVRVAEQKDAYKFLQDNVDTIKPVLDRLGPKHTKNLMDIAEASTITKSVDVPSKVAISMRTRDIVEEATGTTFKSILSQSRAAAQNRVSKSYVMSDIGGKYLFTVKQRETERLLNAALYNPELAADMATWSKELKITPGIVAKIRHHLFTTGALATSRYVEDETALDEEF